VQERVSRLWNEYPNDSEKLSFDMIEKVLSPMDKKTTINVFLNELKKAEWIEVIPSKEDARKKIYKLKEPNILMKELFVKNGN
jgi:hypothetical protein